MCVPLSPVQALVQGGSAGRAVKTAMFPGAAILGAFDKKKSKGTAAPSPSANMGA